MANAVPFLMFSSGEAEQAMELYARVVPDSRIVSIEHYGPAQPGPDGKVYKGLMKIAEMECRFFDSPVPHAFGFTPAISMFVTCSSTAEVDQVFNGLAANGNVMMPLGEYPFSKRFGWTADRFGVSWQIMVAQ